MVSYTKIRAMIRKKWVLENKNGGRRADSNETVFFKPLSTAEPSLPIESALPPCLRRLDSPCLKKLQWLPLK